MTDQTEQLRAIFERVAYERYVEQRKTCGVVDDNAEQVTPEGLFWRTPSGGYGVIYINSAWWGFLQGALAVGRREPVAYRYKGSRGHWRYVGAPFTPGWDMPAWLKHEPLYDGVLAP